MIRPLELQKELSIDVHGGRSTTTQVWATLQASFAGDVTTVRTLVSGSPALSTCHYDYTSPMLLAVREGHVELVRYLISQGALDPDCRNHPFLNPLMLMAADREYEEISKLLAESLAIPGLVIKRDDTGGIDYQRDEFHQRFERAVHANDLVAVEQMLKERPELATDEFSSWGEGVLSVPANHGCREMLELLISYGARVPDISKWARSYYFKHEDIAAFLLDNGMSANHMSWRHVTVLHDMAQEGQLAKARLLLDHGADIDAVDEEYRSTPLGLAARWGHREMVALLLERGADTSKAGASWATPLAWAMKKGHAEIVTELKMAGASV